MPCSSASSDAAAFRLRVRALNYCYNDERQRERQTDKPAVLYSIRDRGRDGQADR